MKEVIITLTTLLTFCSTLFGQWEVLNEGVKGSFNTIDFVDENIGWIAGGQGLLFKTEDAGQTWYPIIIDKKWSIKMIDFISNTIGWAIATGDYDTSVNDIILTTLNGGETWYLQQTLGDVNLISIDVVNDSVVYIIGRQKRGSQATILKTSNRGVTWFDISPTRVVSSLEDIWFINPMVGIVTGHYSENDYERAFVWRTNNGGINWEESTLSDLKWIKNVQIIDDSTAYFLTHLQSDSTGSAIICKTTDMCKSWTHITQGDDCPYICSFFYSGSGYFYSILTPPSLMRMRWPRIAYITKSIDGGVTWEQKIPTGPWNLEHIYFCNDTFGFAFGGGTLLRSVDGGESWTTYKFSYPFEDVYFINTNKGFASGGWLYVHWIGSGDMFVTWNGGKKWEPVISIRQKIESFMFVNDSIGFAVSRVIDGQSDIYKTIDGGVHWICICNNCTSTGQFEGKDIFFINDQFGWAGGYGNYSDFVGEAIISTINGGQTWKFDWVDSSSSESFNYINSINFVNDSTGWAVGSTGSVVKYSIKEGWRKMGTITDLPLNDVFFIDENTGFAAGGYLNNEGFQAVLFKTNNGGTSWKEIPDLPYLLEDIYFYDHLHGWAVGSDKEYSGVILSTNDGGDNWTVQVNKLIGILYDLNFRDGFLWAVGECGLVLRLDIMTAIEDYHEQYLPSRFKLFQNYPNPFNPRTVISWQLAVGSEVDLSIYNILGQKVATLVSQRQPAGYHKVEWDASGLASGIYYYRIVSEAGFVSVKKMVLLK